MNIIYPKDRYMRVRLYNIQWYRKHVSEERSPTMLQKYIRVAHDGKIIAECDY